MKEKEEIQHKSDFLNHFVPGIKVMRKKKILVTGGAGFIGSHIVDLFIKNDYEVVVVDDLSSGKKEHLHRDVKFYQLSIENMIELEKVFYLEKPDYVVHEAAQISVSLSVRKPIHDAKINIIGSLNLLQCCVKYLTKGVIFASSGGTVYGETASFPVHEDCALMPLSPYGIGKVTVEYYLNFYRKTYHLDYVTLRYGNVYGPRQDPFGEAGVIAIFIQKMLKGENPTINGDGNYIRDYVYVKDVAQANLLALKNINEFPKKKTILNKQENEMLNAFNLGTGVGTSVNELFKLLKEMLPYSFVANHGPARPGDLRTNILDCQRIHDVFSWVPKMELSKGLRETINWFQK